MKIKNIINEVRDCEAWIKEKRATYFPENTQDIHNRVWIEKMRTKYFKQGGKR